jgi:hypothetical protein
MQAGLKHVSMSSCLQVCSSNCSVLPANYVTSCGRFKLVNSLVTFNFGRHKGRPLKEVAVVDPSYLDWMRLPEEVRTHDGNK